jgi:hypothetical protein
MAGRYHDESHFQLKTLAMLKKLISILGGTNKITPDQSRSVLLDQAPPKEIMIEGHAPFPIAAHPSLHRGLPVIDWSAVRSWADSIASDELQVGAWTSAEHAWLLHFRDALGLQYRVRLSGTAALLSPLDKNVADATLEYMNRTLKRVVSVLNGVAEAAPWGLDLLIVFENEEQYYDYVSYYYPEDGEYAFSGGMYINDGCGHFVTVQADLRSIEPVIAHEMTHACLSHLPLPLWLDEGLAVNTEQRLAGRSAGNDTPQEMRHKHLSFWGEEEIQEFWSGKSFGRTDDGNRFSYDLARIIVAQFVRDWGQFRNFVLAADWRDAGAAAATEHLGISLGEIASRFLEQSDAAVWEPRALLQEEPEIEPARAPVQ